MTKRPTELLLCIWKYPKNSPKSEWGKENRHDLIQTIWQCIQWTMYEHLQSQSHKHFYSALIHCKPSVEKRTKIFKRSFFVNSLPVRLIFKEKNCNTFVFIEPWFFPRNHTTESIYIKMIVLISEGFRSI